MPGLTIITVTQNQPELLRDRVIPNLLAQTDHDFEWIIINDGSDSTIESIVANLITPFPVNYKVMGHPKQRLGLAQGHNLGKRQAQGDLITYLNDDRQLLPEFVATTKRFFAERLDIRCGMVQQQRQPQALENGVLVPAGKSLISPKANCSVTELIWQQQIFDGNGFTHRRIGSPNWNSDYRIFCHYDYFLQCLHIWGRNCFAINPTILVRTMQASEDCVSYADHSDRVSEMLQIVDRFPQNLALTAEDAEEVYQQIQQWQIAADRTSRIAAFSKRENKGCLMLHS